MNDSALWLKLPPILAWSCILIALPLGHRYGKRLRQQGKNLQTAYEGPAAWLILGLFLASLLTLMLGLRFSYLFPVVLGAYLEPLSWGLIQATLAFLALSALPLSTQRRQGILAVWSGLLAIALVQFAEAWVNQPYPQQQLFDRRARDGSILQSANVTCSAAALANALQELGTPTNEAEAARVLGTRRSGTSDYQLLQGAYTFGLNPQVVQVSAQALQKLLTGQSTAPKDVKSAVIVTVDLFHLRHSVLIDGVDSKGNLLGVDPTAGRVVYTPQRLDQMLLSPRGIQLQR